VEDFVNKSVRLTVIVVIAVISALTVGVAMYWFSHHKPMSLKERVSYTIGSQFGKSLSSQKLDLDPSMVARGLNEGIAGQTPPLSEMEMEDAMVQLNQYRRKEQSEEAARNKIVADSFLATNRLAAGVKITKSGLQYKILAEGHGPSPHPDDLVVINYKASLASDGKEFDSSYKRGTPAQIPVKGVMPGWSEGLQLMKKGGKAIFYVPPDLGYGDQARQNIPSNSVLIFEVEMLDIKKGTR
jgi:FKBP-type peptidyl-prolyl cis-trans isomerase